MLESLLSWSVLVGGVVVVLVGVGFSIMSLSPPEYSGARICFSAAFFIFAARIFWWVGMEPMHGTDGAFIVMLAVGLCVLWATAMRWVDTRQSNDPSIIRQVLQETLTAFIEEGMQIRETYKSLEPIPRTAEEEWEAKVFIYLENNLGHPYAVQFTRPNTIQPVFKTVPPNISEENYMTRLLLNVRLAQLDEIIKVLMG